MSVQSREIKVLAAFLTSLLAGVIILMALGNKPPSAGAFCLSGYYGLGSVEKAILSGLVQPPDQWERIVVYYSGTKGGNVERLAGLSGPAGPKDINCHFVVCNGFGGADGQIQSTEKWHKQCSITTCRNRAGSAQTIHICVIGDSKTARPTDLQIKRVEALVEGLCREFNIEPESIRYPDDWR